jgi:hypothetical protein
MEETATRTNRLPYVDDVVSWLGIAWIVAFLAGLWGAMIGVGKFGLSEFLFLLCGAIVLVKVVSETMRDPTRKRVIALVICLVVIASVEFLVIRWTNGLAVEAKEQQNRLKQLDKIPGLTQQLADLKQQEIVDQTKAQQQVSDIGKANNDLKSSIEKKDAVLASIAKDQYALNFTPQVTVYSQDSPDTVIAVNNGKTNVIIEQWIIDGEVTQLPFSGPSMLIPSANISFMLGDEGKANIPRRAAGADRFGVECSITIRTQDKKLYSLPFTWVFRMKDSAVASSFTIPHPIVEMAGGTGLK